MNFEIRFYLNESISIDLLGLKAHLKDTNG